LDNKINGIIDKSKDILDKIEIIEEPIEWLGKPMIFLNKKFLAFKKLRNYKSKTFLNFNRIYYISLTLLVCSVFSLLYSGYEIIREGPIYNEIPDGAICNDGWRSKSQGPGTCSWHGGVDYYVFKDVQVGYYYSNPFPYLVIGLILISVLSVLYFVNRNYKIPISELVFRILTFVYSLIYIPFSILLMVLRATLQVPIFFPIYIYGIIVMLMPKKK